MYSDTQVDIAIQTIADDFIRTTQCTRTISADIAIADGDDTFSFTIENFRPEHCLRAWIVDQNRLDLIDYQALLDKQVDDPTTGVPQKLAFTSSGTAAIWPTAGDDYTMKMIYYVPFTIWTAGQEDGSATLNLPDDYLRTMLMYGAASALQFNETEHMYASTAYQRYIEFRERMRGAGSEGSKSIQLTRGM